jgi:four helix bundle protein
VISIGKTVGSNRLAKRGTTMQYVKSHRELEVCKLARELAQDVFEISRSFPREEAYSLTDQIRRSSRSIGAQIAEAWGKRKYEKHFVSKLTDDDSEQLETQHWIATATDCKYFSENQSNELSTKCNAIGKMLNSMIKKSSQFCKD